MKEAPNLLVAATDVEHYRQRVSYVWHNYRCVDGNWDWQDVVFDHTTREFTLRFEAI